MAVPQPPVASAGSFAGRVCRATIAIGLTAFVLWKSDPRAVLQAAAVANWRFVGLAIVAVVIDRALNAFRWLALLCVVPSAPRPALGAVLRIFFVSTFVGTFLPASVGGDAVRAYALSRRNVALSDSLASVVMDRALGVLSILMLGVVGLLLVRDLEVSRSAIGALALTTAGCVVMGLIIFSARIDAVVRTLMDRLPGVVARQRARRVMEAVQRYSSFRTELANVVVVSVVVQMLRVLQAYFLGLAIGMTAPLAVYFAFIPVILLVMLLPITINGIGTSQAAFVWFFGRAGVPDAEAFTLSILFLALGLVGNIPGGLISTWDQLRGR
ncbi:MAG: flippase-like domain-containing protein [Acidobacteria bacterium]|nr:flippase-like domain-containing protein [Acidobacteriota bacterium]